MDTVMMSVPKYLGKKFVYSKVSQDVQTRNIKKALNLLCKARVCHRVTSCHANGVPLLQHGSTVVPLEVKAGKTGSLKSLHLFMRIKGLSYAVRINFNYPSITPVDVKDFQGNAIHYTLYSLPFYLLGQVLRLVPHELELI